MSGTPPVEASQAGSVIDLRPKLRVVGDQGPRGTCVAFAVTAVHEYHRSRHSGDAPEDLAEEVLFWGAKQVDADLLDGTRFSSAHTALQRWGQPRQELWPYDMRRDHRVPDYRPPADAINPANCRVSGLRQVGTDLPDILKELTAGTPVVLGVPVWDDLRRGTTEPLPPPTVRELYPTRHAVAVVGYDPVGLLLVRNSWGSGWGYDGHLWMRAEILRFAIAAWVIDDGTTTAAVTSLREEGVLTDVRSNRGSE
jgi:C1A family cysteine protease